LKIDYKISTNGIFTVFDISGRIIKTINLPATTQHIVTDISDLTKGIYTYKVYLNGQTISNGKIIKD
jgi:Secretion system C-terminal sorting domain